MSVAMYGRMSVSDERVNANVDRALDCMNVLSWGVMWRMFVMNAEEGMRRHELMSVTRKFPTKHIVDLLGELPEELRLHCLKKANVKVLREFLTSRQQPDDGLKPVLVARVLALCNTEV